MLELSEHLVIHGNLDLHGSDIEEIAAYLTVCGNLDLSNSKVRKLGACLEVCPDFYRMSDLCEGHLNLKGTQVTHLPDDSRIAILDLANTNIRTYGRNVTIETLS